MHDFSRVEKHFFWGTVYIISSLIKLKTGHKSWHLSGPHDFFREQLSRCVEFLRAQLEASSKMNLEEWHSGIHFESKAKQLQAIALVKWQLIMMASQEVSSSGGVQFRLTLRWFKNRVRPQLHYFWYHIVSWGQLKSQLLTEFLTRSSDNDFANAFITIQ